jgi:hypothetical protein
VINQVVIAEPYLTGHHFNENVVNGGTSQQFA